MEMRKKSVLVLVIGPVSLCSPSVYIVIVVVTVLVVVVLANVMSVCVCFLQYILLLCTLCKSCGYNAHVYRGAPRQRTLTRSAINGTIITII